MSQLEESAKNSTEGQQQPVGFASRPSTLGVNRESSSLRSSQSGESRELKSKSKSASELKSSQSKSSESTSATPESLKDIFKESTREESLKETYLNGTPSKGNSSKSSSPKRESLNGDSLKEVSSRADSLKTSESSQSSQSSSSPSLNYYDLNIASYQNIKTFSDLPQSFGYNQHIAIDKEIREQMRQVLWKFNAPIRYAFAYGSGVFSQGSLAGGSRDSRPQIDMIFAVSYTQHWHSLNLKQNPQHYSALRYLGSGAVSYVQDYLGAGLYFNPYVEINGLKVKYGVVNISTLREDLKDWNTLYLAGRLHKPVKILRDEPQIRFMNQANLISVLRTSLLLLPETFSELDLYKMIAGISYMGDFRMTFGENPNKVSNIVENQFLNFRNLYAPLMDWLPNLQLVASSESQFSVDGKQISVATLEQDMSPVRRGNMVIRLPKEFRDKLYSRYADKFNDKDILRAIRDDSIEEDPKRCTAFDKRIAGDVDLPKEISRAIRHTVAWPSVTQSAKGIATAGLVRSAKYSAEKLGKYYFGRGIKSNKS